MIARTRFSLSSLLLLTTLVAGGMAYWRAYLYEPPTHKFSLYERALGTRGRYIEVGPNDVALRMIARNDRDRSVHYATERTSKYKLTAAQEADMAAAAPWLDIVRIELDPGPELVDIIEVRIFNSVTHELLSEVNRAYGWQLTASNAVDIYGLGKQLPPKVDLWFRAQSYAAGESVTTLARTPGASCKMAGASIKLPDIRAGFWTFDGRQFTQPSGQKEYTVSTVLDLEGQSPTEKLQIAAVTKSGEKIHPDLPHFLNFYAGQPQLLPVEFNLPLAELSHFEIRPFGGRSTFFFEGVALPQPSSLPFSKPPSARINVAGQEVRAKLKEFGPSEVNIALHRGSWATGTSSTGLWAAVMPAENVTDKDRAFTLEYNGRGAGALEPHFDFFDAATKRRIPDSELKRHGSGVSSGATVSAGFIEFGIPLERIGSLEVTLGQ